MINLEPVIAEYADFAVQIKNNPQLAEPVKADIMQKMAQSLSALVPLLNNGQEEQQQKLMQSQQQHDLNMQMQQEKHMVDMQMQQQKHSMNLEMNRQKAQQAYSKQQKKE